MGAEDAETGGGGVTAGVGITFTRGKSSLEGLDHDATLWHGRESASMLVHRHALETERAKVSKGFDGQGVLQGVVFPCMGNILGVILFLRLPWIVGKAGILETFLLVLVCCCCTFITTLSLSAVATNGRIPGGGCYFLISRSLGPALGSGVGLCFYMANSIGAAMYFMGTVEAWEVAQPGLQIIGAGNLNNVRVTALLILAVALILVGGGIKYVARLGTVFLFIVLGVILCMYVGCFVGPWKGDGSYSTGITIDGEESLLNLTWTGPSLELFKENLGPAYEMPQKAFAGDDSKYSFISLMGLWFPAVTGIMAGSNRSADLKDPAADIPRGTLCAQLVTSFVYLSFVLIFGFVAPRQTLLDDRFFAASSAWPCKQVVQYGVIFSATGAGLTSLVSGTRLLSAIAGDKTLPILQIFAAPPGSEPRLALVASGMLCACAIAIGELNVVAPVLTMFFLMCYTCVNLSCTILEAVHDPSWRPKFKYHHWSISLLGAILCIWMMFAMSPIMATCAICFCAVIFAYAAYNSHSVKWGDGFQGIKFQLARNILTHMDLTAHTKNWRPQLLVITGASIFEQTSTQEEKLCVHDPALLSLASQLKGGRGLTILGGICSSRGVPVFSDGGMFISQEQRQKVLDGQDSMKRLLQQYQIEGFGRMVYTQDYADGLMCLVQISGLGAFQPNCVLAAWPKDVQKLDKHGSETRSHLIRMIQVAVVFQKVVLIAKGSSWPDFEQRLHGHIDIWWIVGDGGILLLLPFLLAKHSVWHGCHLRLFVLADKVGDDPEMMMQELQTYVSDFRLNIEVHVKVIDPDAYDTSPLADSYPVQNAIEEDDVDLEVANEHPEPRRTVSSESFEEVPPWRSVSNLSSNLGRWRRQTSSSRSSEVQGSLPRAFPRSPPGTIGSVPEAAPPGVDSISFSPRAASPVAGAEAAEARRNLGFLYENAATDPGPSRGVRSHTAGNFGSEADKAFMYNEKQLTSDKPCSQDELILARGLNCIIMEESSNADLVVMNLPDMPPGESAFGYCQLIEEMTKGFTRSMLVRGTAKEVITAFT